MGPLSTAGGEGILTLDRPLLAPLFEEETHGNGSTQRKAA